MTDAARPPDLARSARLNRRYRAEQRFKAYGMAAIALAFLALIWLLATIAGKAYSAFEQSYLTLDIHFDAETIDPDRTGDRQALRGADYYALIRDSLYGLFPDAAARADKRALRALLGYRPTLEAQLRDMVLDDPGLIGTSVAVRLIASDDVDMFVKGVIGRTGDQAIRRVDDRQIAWIDALVAAGRLDTAFNSGFFANGDSREPEIAGIWSATVGSIWTLLICLLLSVPTGVMAAVYLEEFAPTNRLTDVIEVNINNLAAVPSIVFGLLGLAVLLGFLGMARSSPLVGGTVLALMTLPTIIIAARATLKAVPPSIREAALGVGASKMQTVLHHVLPLAMPGIMTGTIIGMARALGETAPLLMIGMVAFIPDVPGGPTDPATVLPVQIYLWSDSPERAFAERTSAAILVLLAFLIVMNAGAVILRRKFERRW